MRLLRGKDTVGVWEPRSKCNPHSVTREAPGKKLRRGSPGVYEHTAFSLFP